MFLVIVCDSTFEDVRYGISHRHNFDVSGCIYVHAYTCIYIAAQLKLVCIMHGWMCWWGKVLGLGEKPEQYQKRCKASLPALASSWELRSQWQVLVGLPQCYLHPEVRNYKLLLFQISGDNHPYEDQFWKFYSCFLSCLSCLWQVGVGGLPLWLHGTKQNVAGAVCDTLQWAVSV